MSQAHSMAHTGEAVLADVLPVSACNTSDPSGDRTHDLRIKSPLLYQLSYRVALTASERKVVGVG